MLIIWVGFCVKISVQRVWFADSAMQNAYRTCNVLNVPEKGSSKVLGDVPIKKDFKLPVGRLGLCSLTRFSSVTLRLAF